MHRFALIDTAWGPVAIVAVGGRLCRLLLPGPPSGRLAAQVRAEHPQARQDQAVLPGLQRAIRRYFRGQRVHLALQPELGDCPAFWVEVYRACQAVGYGQLTSYGELARLVGRPGAARAVGAALRRNPVPLVVPCHRVIRSDGRLGGFSGPGGLEMKRRMLLLEGIAIAEPRRIAQRAAAIRAG